MELIGHIGVDSGQVMVGDPCYLDDWGAGEFTDWQKKDITPTGTFDYNGACTATSGPSGAGVLGNETAVAVSSGYGDGSYPVYVERNSEGRIARLIVEFMESSEDVEDDEDSNF